MCTRSDASGLDCFIMGWPIFERSKQRTETDLVLEEEPAKCPDGTEDEEEFVDLFTGVGRCVLWR